MCNAKETTISRASSIEPTRMPAGMKVQTEICPTCQTGHSGPLCPPAQEEQATKAAAAQVDAELERRRCITAVWEYEAETGRRDRGVVHRSDGRPVVVSIPIDEHREQWQVEQWERERGTQEQEQAAELARLKRASTEREAAKLSARPILSASRIELRTGTEGPKDDPYSFEEWTLTRGSDTWLVHIGLGEWLKHNGAIVARPDGGEMEPELKAAGCPLSLRQMKRYYRRIKSAPLRLHKAHGGVREADGMPGEALLICKCGEILDSEFNINAII